jgi:hypothetical protein
VYSFHKQLWCSLGNWRHFCGDRPPPKVDMGALLPLYKPRAVAPLLVILDVSFELIFNWVSGRTLSLSTCHAPLVTSQGRHHSSGSPISSFRLILLYPATPPRCNGAVIVETGDASRPSSTSLPSPPRVLARGCDAFHAAQEATKVEAELVRVQLIKVDDRIVSKSFHSHFFYGFPLLLSCPFLVVALEAELEMSCHCSGQLLDYVGAHGASLIERLDNAPCCIRDIADFGVHHGVVVALLMAEVCSSYHHQDLIGPPFIPLR